MGKCISVRLWRTTAPQQLLSLPCSLQGALQQTDWHVEFGMGLKVGRPSSHKPCTHLPLEACTGEDTRGAPPRGCIFGATWLGIFLWATHHRHTEVTSHKQTEATITATKWLCGYKKKKQRKNTFFIQQNFVSPGLYFFFIHLYLHWVSICVAVAERGFPKARKPKELFPCVHTISTFLALELT